MIKNLVKTRLPTGFGEFTLYLYSEHGKEHLALVKGDVHGKADIPVRVHSECLTGDVFGSRRCDCGDQLRHSLQYLGRVDAGILIYLRQEGRGIGLMKKMEAYNLQDQGMDTVEANIHLGHQPDERDYGIAARILRDLGAESIRLITNNPHKVEELRQHGIEVAERIPIEVGYHSENLGYLRSKAERMAHLLSFRERMPEDHELAFIEPLIDQLTLSRDAEHPFPFVTLAYTQGLDGRIANTDGQTSALGSEPVLALARHLRSQHDGLLVDVDTLLSDDSRLNGLFRAEGTPRLIILDRQLRTPLDCKAFQPPSKPPIILTAGTADPNRRAQLVQRGARVVHVDADTEGCLNLRPALAALTGEGIHTLMVEGGGTIISTFLKQHLVNYCVITITPKIIGGLKAIEDLPSGGATPLSLADCHYQPLGSDLIAYGPVQYG